MIKRKFKVTRFKNGPYFVASEPPSLFSLLVLLHLCDYHNYGINKFQLVSLEGHDNVKFIVTFTPC